MMFRGRKDLEMGVHSFVHLRARSAYSLLESTLHVKDLAKLCAAHDMPAMALTDANNLFGALEFSEAFAEKGVQPIVGVSLDVRGEDVHGAVALLARNSVGYSNLMALSSAAYLETEQGEEPHVPLDRVLDFSDGLIALTGGWGGQARPGAGAD
jgi:DNA polymerase III subunit alpha